MIDPCQYPIGIRDKLLRSEDSIFRGEHVPFIYLVSDVFLEMFENPAWFEIQ
jgi:hypothetical protein